MSDQNHVYATAKILHFAVREWAKGVHAVS
jgi:hypothetical protein